MSSPARRGPIKLAVVVALCAAVLSIRLLMGYAHTQASAPLAGFASSVQGLTVLPDALPPVW
jgi:hypothetical protein